MKFLLIALPAVLLCCTSKNESRKELNQDNLRGRYFREDFLKKFKKFDLPCTVEHNPKDAEIVFANPNSLDTLFFSLARIGYNGMLSDTSNFFTVFVYMYGAVKPIPMIVTFDKKGNQISATSIDFGCWDGGPYDYTCSGGFVINPDMSISLNHETIVTKSYGSDSTEVFPWKDTHNWKGRILKNGVVEIEKRPQ